VDDEKLEPSPRLVTNKQEGQDMTTTDTTPLEAAEQMLAGLDAALLRLKARGVELEDERTNIALAAHAGKDAKARKRLDELNLLIGTHGSEVTSLMIAVAAQEKVVQQAKAEEQRAEDRDSALKLRDQYKRFVKLADVADEHLRSFVAAAGEIKKTVDAIHAINPGSAPTAQQLLVFGEMAVRAAVMQTMWTHSVEFLAPNQRHTFPRLARGWAEPAIRAIDQALGDEKKEVA
jgi:hypothetical protein